MNFLTFVFSLLIIFSFGTFVVIEKRSGDRQMRDSYLGHILANRKLLSECESKTYRSFKSVPKESKPFEKKIVRKEPPKVNPDCAKLNIFELVKDGKEKHPHLYKTTLTLIDNLYGNSLFKDRPQETAYFLNTFLKHAGDAVLNNQLSMEKIMIGSSFQTTYYRMLKGTKNWNVQNELEYPSILDIMKIDPTPTKVCLSHAHQGLLMGILGKKPGRVLFDELYSEEPPALNQELVEKAFSKAYQIPPSQDILDLLEMGKSSHQNIRKTTLIATDEPSGITIRKNIYTP